MLGGFLIPFHFIIYYSNAKNNAIMTSSVASLLFSGTPFKNSMIKQTPLKAPLVPQTFSSCFWVKGEAARHSQQTRSIPLKENNMFNGVKVQESDFQREKRAGTHGYRCDGESG